MGEAGTPPGFTGLAADYVDTTPQAARLVALARLAPGERVLDAGCGPGTATVLAAARVGPGGAVVGADVAEGMPARARERMGAVAVVAESESIVQSFASPSDAWASLYRHGARLFLDALPPDALGAFREEFTARVATDGGAELRSEFLYRCFTTPG